MRARSPALPTRVGLYVNSIKKKIARGWIWWGSGRGEGRGEAEEGKKCFEMGGRGLAAGRLAGRGQPRGASDRYRGVRRGG